MTQFFLTIYHPGPYRRPNELLAWPKGEQMFVPTRLAEIVEARMPQVAVTQNDIARMLGFKAESVRAVLAVLSPAAQEEVRRYTEAIKSFRILVKLSQGNREDLLRRLEAQMELEADDAELFG